MKRAMVYLIAISVLLTALLAGCGEIRTGQSGTAPTNAPETMILPDVTPDASDGMVGDTDGIITEGDNGTVSGSGMTDGNNSSMTGGSSSGTTGGTQSGGSTAAGANTLGKGTKTGTR